MHCPYCYSQKSEVVETRDNDELDTIRRRRTCLGCQRRFTTYERIETMHLIVVKRDGKREQYNREKLKSGILKACEKTRVSVEAIEKIVATITKEMRCSDAREIESKKIGDLVALELKAIDEVAYIRFASVFKRFVDAEDFEKEIQGLTALVPVKN
jgi:transcriptional repressor NrdR